MEFTIIHKKTGATIELEAGTTIVVEIDGVKYEIKINTVT
jgi:hypothetical protein